MFLTLTMKEGITVGFGGCQYGRIIGMRTTGNSSISINNVWFVDGLRHNLLNISRFCDSGPSSSVHDHKLKFISL